VSLDSKGKEDRRNEDREVDDHHLIILPPLVAALEVPRQTILRHNFKKENL
jgi:hypothetical protein